MRHLLFLFITGIILYGRALPQDKPPVVVIGIVVENMRPDYLDRFRDCFGEGGFRKLQTGGWNCTGLRMDQLVQNNATGTATLFTGVTPSRHGIIDVSWYDRVKATEKNCVHDDKYVTLGSTSRSGSVSPSQLLSLTLADQLKLSTLGKGKVFSIAMNSAPAVLSAGFSPDGVYWYDEATGNMVTSSYYRKDLPQWVSGFNGKKTAKSFTSKNWALMKPMAGYRECNADNDSLETGFGPGMNVFPYNLEELMKITGDFSFLKATPFANTLLKSFFLSLVEEEKIGEDNFPDLVTLFFSSMDEKSLEFGPSSMETEDLFLRMDREIEEIVQYLDKKFGKDKVLVYLTSNTSASYPVNYLRKRFRIPAGYFSPDNAHALLNTYLHATFGDLRWTEHVSTSQVYLNHNLTGINKVDPGEIRNKAAGFLSQFEGIQIAVTSDQIRQNILPENLMNTLGLSWCPGRSGDVVYLLRDGWQPQAGIRKVPFTNQQQIPLIFYGAGIISKTDRKPCSATDLTPTLATLLGILPPAFCEGRPIELIREKE